MQRDAVEHGIAGGGHKQTAMIGNYRRELADGVRDTLTQGEGGKMHTRIRRLAQQEAY